MCLKRVASSDQLKLAQKGRNTTDGSRARDPCAPWADAAQDPQRQRRWGRGRSCRFHEAGPPISPDMAARCAGRYGGAARSVTRGSAKHSFPASSLPGSRSLLPGTRSSSLVPPPLSGTRSSPRVPPPRLRSSPHPHHQLPCVRHVCGDSVTQDPSRLTSRSVKRAPPGSPTAGVAARRPARDRRRSGDDVT